MSQPQPTQPNQPQYQISTLNLFPVYTTRAAYQQATGQQAPPFDPTQPVKGWADPAPTGQPYLVFDSTAVGTGYLNQLTLSSSQAAQLNLPGTYNYPAYVSPPTDAVEVGPFGPIGATSPDVVCLQTDAQALANELAPLYPRQTLAVVQGTGGVFHYQYGLDPRRVWAIQAGNISLIAQQLIEAKNVHGVGAPGHWTLASTGLNWIYDPPVSTAPPNSLTLPVPVRPLLPNEQIVHLPGSLFNAAGTWVVSRSDLQQPTPPETNDQQFADLRAAIVAIQIALAAIQAKLGA
jgi:hypothetical protein